jgi:Holliday junction resolvase RusA-like endonuclease
MTDDCAIIYLDAPLPPSTNALYINVKGRGRIKSRDYRGWSQSKGWEILTQKPQKFVVPVHLIIIAKQPKRQRDGDNLLKPLLDLLVTQQIIPDDSHKYVKGVSFQWTERPLLRGSACVIIISKSAMGGLHLLNEVYEKAETA